LEQLLKKIASVAMNEEVSTQHEVSTDLEMYYRTNVSGLYVTTRHKEIAGTVFVTYDDEEQKRIWHSDEQPDRFSLMGTESLRGRHGTRLAGVFVDDEILDQSLKIWYISPQDHSTVICLREFNSVERSVIMYSKERKENTTPLEQDVQVETPEGDDSGHETESNCDEEDWVDDDEAVSNSDAKMEKSIRKSQVRGCEHVLTTGKAIYICARRHRTGEWDFLIDKNRLCHKRVTKGSIRKKKPNPPYKYFEFTKNCKF
jgi:hypothetical protein